MRTVVEKELLHHDILREMAEAGLLQALTFIGGTCLRACYGSNRLSEDLDFTGGTEFNRAALASLGDVLVERLQAKYGLSVRVSEPVRDSGKVATWKMRVMTRPGRHDLPAQRINIDICAIPSHDRRPMLLRNPYGVDMGTSGLILQAESRDEILADKLIAFVLRPNRIKHRDLWDIGWLVQQGTELPLSLIPVKIKDHQRTTPDFLARLTERRRQLLEDPEIQAGFVREMARFLPQGMISKTLMQKAFWTWLTELIADMCKKTEAALDASETTRSFPM
ncbi:nucleotidyl transferase AbiEii/AbiGii toxin family protein [Thiorhodovibrio winogradskyi]|uniref:nucleotidyl transferase AbiEii/AbiGii toxin family protein n=1 Tax=Thiorhodovibrio winogradskyi TaxID=77007 RepID=UPI002E2C4E34|nr:nucleotidyl transferase AbiEii/AbiGii toxin family protein [Thiorhodovibrio winogradskyi]